MLSKTDMVKASTIAGDLLKDGMVWGDDLEYFIKSQVYRRNGFKSDEDYFKFENTVLDLAEERAKRKKIEIIDIETNERFVLNSRREASKILGCNEGVLSVYLRKNGVYKSRYKISYAKLKLNEI
ncbi:TPA: hypothetical protein KO112_003521 [Clostridioides difficile]|nr:hypothetical protein [Clostridioides difficile]HCQ5562644.1 hypothetical protein [Clostridioides difficile]